MERLDYGALSACEDNCVNEDATEENRSRTESMFSCLAWRR